MANRVTTTNEIRDGLKEAAKQFVVDILYDTQRFGKDVASETAFKKLTSLAEHIESAVIANH